MIMRRKYWINSLFIASLFALFLWQSIIALLKYLEGATVTSTSNFDNGTILFPSVTVCKRYVTGFYKNDVENVTLDIQQKINHFRKNIWRKNEVFYFFSHSNMFNLTFPCTTKESIGNAPGKACSFPSLDFKNKNMEYECNGWGNCVTRLYTNLLIHVTLSIRIFQNI